MRHTHNLNAWHRAILQNNCVITDILARIYESFYSLYTFMFLFVMAGPYQLCSNFFAIVYNQIHYGSAPTDKCLSLFY